jgi:putative acetyltransferase
MSIRDYKTSDLVTVLEVYAQSKLDELRFENGEFSLLPLDEDEKRFRALKESQIYVYDDGVISGYGALCEGEIRALFVLPARRGEGIGKKLLEFLLREISGEACLYVAATNYPAKKLYESYGFIVVDEFQTNYNRVPVFANKMVRARLRG